MKKLSKIILSLVLVVVLTLSMAACVKVNPVETPPPTVSPTPDVSIDPSPSKTPGREIEFPPKWEKPVANEIKIEDLSSLEGSGRYTVANADISEDVSIVNLDFAGKISFNSLKAKGVDITINMPKATLDFAAVECSNLIVTSGLNTAKLNGSTLADVKLLGGNAVVGEWANVQKLTIDKDNKTSRTIDIKGGVTALFLDAQMEVKMSGDAQVATLTATQPAQISVSGTASLKAFENKTTSTTIKSSITIAGGASVTITENSGGGLLIDATASNDSKNVKLEGNDGTVEVVIDVKDPTKGQINVSETVKNQPTETNKGILTFANSPIEIVNKTKNANGYLKFNFTHLENYTVVASVMSRDGNKFLENATINGAGQAKSFGWALRDYVAVDEAKNGDTVQDTVALRDASNKFLSRKDDEIIFSITATEKTPEGGFAEGVTAKTQTLTYNYKITEVAEKNSAITITGAGENGKIVAYPTTMFSSLMPSVEKNSVNVGFKFNSGESLQKFRFYDVSSIVVKLFANDKEISTSTANILEFGDCFDGNKDNLFTAQFFANNYNSGHWLRKGNLAEGVVPTRATLKMVMRDGQIVTAEQTKFTNVNGNEYMTKYRKEDGIVDNGFKDTFSGGAKSQSYAKMFGRVMVNTAEELNAAVKNSLTKEIVVAKTVTLSEDLTINAGQTLIVPIASTLTIPSGKNLAIQSGGTIHADKDAMMTIDGELTKEDGANVEFFANRGETLEEYLEAGQSVTITNDITLPNGNIIDIANGKKAVLNMAGFKVTFGGVEARPIQNNGEFRIFNGTFEVTSGGSFGVIDNIEGTLYAENCTFTDVMSTANASVLRNRPNATMTLKNVNVYSNSQEATANACIYNDGKLKIDGGDFRCMSGLPTRTGTYAIRSMGGEFEIANATVYGAKGALALCGGVQKVLSGTFKATNWYALYIAGEESNTSATILGGVFESDGVACVSIGNDNTNGDGGINAPAYAQIKGGNFKSAPNKPVLSCPPNTGKAVVSGGIFNQDIDDGENFGKGYVKEGYECVAKGADFVVTKVSFVTVSSTDELIEAIANAKDGDSIKLSEGTFTLTSPLSVDKTLTINGTGTGNTMLLGTIVASKQLTLKNLTIEAETALGKGVITSNDDKANLFLENVKLIQNKSGTADSFGKTTSGIVTDKGNANSPNGVSVILRNSEILLNGKFQRGIAAAGDATGGAITLDNSKITSTDNPKNATYSRGISTYGMTNMVVNITNNSRIDGVYYAINTSTDAGLTVNVDNSFVAGFAAINCWSSNTKFNIKNGSILEGRNYYPNGSNDFATIVINDNVVNNKINIENSTIQNIADGDASEFLIDTRRSSGTKVTITGNSQLINNKDNVAIKTIYGNGTVVSIADSVKFGGLFGANDADLTSSDIVTLAVGKTVVMNESISVSPTVKLCKFVPSASGKYKFVGNNDVDNLFVALDKNGVYQMSNDDKSGTALWFDATVNLIAGQTFYCYIGAWSGNPIEVNVTISKVG